MREGGSDQQLNIISTCECVIGSLALIPSTVFCSEQLVKKNCLFP